MKKIILFFLILISLVFTVQGATINYFNEDFNVYQRFTDYGYTYFDGGCAGQSGKYAVVSPLGTYAWGINDTLGCVGVHAINAYKSSGSSVVNGILFARWDYIIVNDSTYVNIPLQLTIANETNSAYRMMIKMFHNATYMAWSSGNNCSVNWSTLNKSLNVSHSVELYASLDDMTYTLAVDGVNDGCLQQALISDMNVIGGISYQMTMDSSETLIAYLDNIDLDVIDVIGGALSEFDTGSYCDNASQCISGYCFRNVCSLKGYNEGCSSDSECVSEECINDHCTKPSIWDSMDASKNEQFGDDSDSNNFLALFIMTFIAIFFIVAGAKADHIKAGLVGGIATFFILGLFFTIVGWLSPFITIGMIIIMLVLIIFGFMIGGSSD